MIITTFEHSYSWELGGTANCGAIARPNDALEQSNKKKPSEGRLSI